MFIAGLDFTSNPGHTKKNKIIIAEIINENVTIKEFLVFSDFKALTNFFSESGPLFCGCDFPFNFPVDYQNELSISNFTNMKKFIKKFDKNEFKTLLRKIQNQRKTGNKYTYRLTDKENSAGSPVNVINPPIGLMLFEGLKMFASIDCSVYPFEKVDTNKINFFEVYPKSFLKNNNFLNQYKNENKNIEYQFYNRKKYTIAIKKFIEEKLQLRILIPNKIEQELYIDFRGDVLDAFICLTITLNIYKKKLHKCPLKKIYKKEGFIFNGLEN